MLTHKQKIREYLNECKRIGLFRAKLIELRWLPEDQGIVVNGTRCTTLDAVMGCVSRMT